MEDPQVRDRGYNCAGLVWNSRRSVLPSPDDWWRILEDDGYRPLGRDEEIKIGDIVVYVKGGQILHVAKICELCHCQAWRKG